MNIPNAGLILILSGLVLVAWLLAAGLAYPALSNDTHQRKNEH